MGAGRFDRLSTNGQQWVGKSGMGRHTYPPPFALSLSKGLPGRHANPHAAAPSGFSACNAMAIG